ncbi:hypothetical protein LEP1GSC166_3651 [Leptospira kirschneri]|nr:hypothetical protein LEP1GSC166_3651 [Leptospira kirschneri]
MVIDTSSKFEGEEVYKSICLGLEFFLAEDDNQSNSYHLSIISEVDEFDFDGSEKEIDLTRYILTLLKKKEIQCEQRNPKLLYGSDEP